MQLPTIYAQDKRGIWHTAKRTYPASADTLCEMRNEPCGQFSTNPGIEDHRPRYCPLCQWMARHDPKERKP